jgi:NifU-like protein
MRKAYPEKIAERLNDIRRGGAVEAATVSAGAANFDCGSAVRVFLRISPENVIEDAGFRTNGCGFAAAAADVLAEYLCGRELKELHGFGREETTLRIAETLGEFPAERANCLDMAAEAFSSALADHRSRLIEEFTGEKALICTCFGVSEDRIVEVVGGLEDPTVEKVGEICNAGRGCGSCRMMIDEIIRQQAENFDKAGTSCDIIR